MMARQCIGSIYKDFFGGAAGWSVAPLFYYGDEARMDVDNVTQGISGELSKYIPSTNSGDKNNFTWKPRY